MKEPKVKIQGEMMEDRNKKQDHGHVYLSQDRATKSRCARPQSRPSSSMRVYSLWGTSWATCMLISD